MSSSSSSWNSSPCAACKTQRRKCPKECVFAPYFPPDNPQRFTCVHKVFGASNVAKLLHDLNASQREDAVKSLAYEAEARLRDPVYGCVGLISLLHHKLKHLQTELHLAKKELASYIGPHAVPPPFPTPQIMGAPVPAVHGHGGGRLVIRHPREFEMMHQQELLRFSDGGGCEGGSASQSGFNQLSTASLISPSLALGSSDDSYRQIQTDRAEYHLHHQHEHALHHQLQAHLMLSPPTTQHSQQSIVSRKHPKSESADGRSTGLSW